MVQETGENKVKVYQGAPYLKKAASISFLVPGLLNFWGNSDNRASYKHCLIRERSFLILGTRAEDFCQGYETSFHYFVAV